MGEPDQNEHDDADDSDRADFPPAPPDPDEAHEEAKDAEPESEPQEASAPAAPTQDEMEVKFRKLAASATTWRNRISAVLGEDANALVQCELCEPDLPGWHWPVEVERPRDETHARLLAALAAPTEPQYRSANHVRACSECDGYGKVISGSKVESNRLVVCVACKGAGFLGDAAPAMNGAGDTPPVLVAVPAVGEPPTLTDADLWGSPRLLADGQENPNYGKMPQYKNPSLP